MCDRGQGGGFDRCIEKHVRRRSGDAGKRLSETSNETISGNLFYANHDADISLPLESPRSHDNHSDHNALNPDPSFVINNNSGRIPVDTILAACRERLKTDVPTNQHPDADPKRVVTLSLPQWRSVIQMDQNSTPLPAKFTMHLDKERHQLQIDLPSADAIPTTPAGPVDDFDLLREPVQTGEAHAGAIEHQHAGIQTTTVWPLLKVARALP